MCNLRHNIGRRHVLSTSTSFVLNILVSIRKAVTSVKLQDPMEMASDRV